MFAELWPAPAPGAGRRRTKRRTAPGRCRPSAKNTPLIRRQNVDRLLAECDSVKGRPRRGGRAQLEMVVFITRARAAENARSQHWRGAVLGLLFVARSGIPRHWAARGPLLWPLIGWSTGRAAVCGRADTLIGFGAGVSRRPNCWPRAALSSLSNIWGQIPGMRSR